MKLKPLSVRDLRALLMTGPKTKEDVLEAGFDIYELRSRLTDLRHALAPEGATILRRDGPSPTWELVFPE